MGWRTRDSIQFTQRDYNSIDVAGIAASLLAPLIVSCFLNHSIVFIFFALVFTPAALFNTLFHVGASVLNEELLSRRDHRGDDLSSTVWRRH